MGPASSSAKTITSLINSGMDVARLNFSHGAYTDHEKIITRLREISKKIDRPVALLQDLQGIKIRLGMVENGSTYLKKGNLIKLAPSPGLSTDSTVYISYPRLLKDVKVNDRILVNDGLILLKVISKEKKYLNARVIDGGLISDKKGVNMPDTDIKLSSFTRKDKKDLEFGLHQSLDFVAISFVQRVEDVLKIKKFIAGKNKSTPVIAKIEKPEALKNIESIIKASDGIMIARGDLGVEMNTEEVPMIQKMLIRLANRYGKVVITATQMLESMTEHLRPTRAEANDVANATLDGSDALMLSAETSVGEYPTQAVAMMSRIIEHTEKNRIKAAPLPRPEKYEMGQAFAVCDAANRAAEDVKASCIVALTNSGNTARLISRFRPSCPILALATSEATERILRIYWGVSSYYMKPFDDAEKMIKEVEIFLKKKSLVKKGDIIIIIASLPLSLTGQTNLMKIHKIT